MRRTTLVQHGLTLAVIAAAPAIHSRFTRNADLLRARGTGLALEGDPASVIAGRELIYASPWQMTALTVVALLLAIWLGPLLYRLVARLWQRRDPREVYPGQRRSFLRVVALIIMPLALASCSFGPGVKYEYYTTGSGETIYRINTTSITDQSQVDSEGLRKAEQLSVQQVPITLSKKAKNSRIWPLYDIMYVPDSKLYVVSRSQVTQKWFGPTGPDNPTGGLEAESLESIGYRLDIECTGDIPEQTTRDFLYFYAKNAQRVEGFESVWRVEDLTTVMNSNVRSYLYNKLGALIGSKKIDDIINNKASYLAEAQKETAEYFRTRGIEIVSCGINGGIQFDSAEIQNALDAKYQAQVNAQTAQQEATARKTTATLDLEAAKSVANAEVAKAKGAADATIEKARGDLADERLLAELIRENPGLVEAMRVQKWNGQLPTWQGVGAQPFMEVQPPAAPPAAGTTP